VNRKRSRFEANGKTAEPRTDAGGRAEKPKTATAGQRTPRQVWLSRKQKKQKKKGGKRKKKKKRTSSAGRGGKTASAVLQGRAQRTRQTELGAEGRHRGARLTQRPKEGAPF